MSTHPKTQMVIEERGSTSYRCSIRCTPSTRHYWTNYYRCPVCRKSTKRLANMMRRRIICDGERVVAVAVENVARLLALASEKE